jgi:Icc-related predicted phosphoesterase
MKIVLMSDIHVEFGALEKPMPKGDVLVLGGDITLTGIWDPDSQHYKHRRITERTMALLDAALASFDRIFYLIGNHEAYGSDLSKTPSLIRKHMKGVTLLDDKAVELGDGVILAGGTLWTDMDDGKAAFRVGRGMNDFRVVAYTKEGRTGTFDPATAMEMFAATKAFIAKTAKANPDKTIVVATHHAPSIQGLNPEHVDDRAGINHGYYTDLHSFIEAHPNIRWWLHGHTHIQTSYPIGQCTVVSNARGYINQESSADTFDPDCWFDPVTGESKLPGVKRKRSQFSRAPAKQGR